MGHTHASNSASGSDRRRTRQAATRSVTFAVGPLALVMSTSLLVACSSEYVYGPTVNTSAVISGAPASHYSIPPAAPRGDVMIATSGFADIRPEGTETKLRALHVRLIVANNSDAPWTVDTREQRVALPGAGQSRAAYATVDEGALPVVVISPGRKRTFDLFYPLPPDLQRARDLPSFDTIWRVETDTGPVVQRTPFERIQVAPAYDASYPRAPYGYAWGTAWAPPYYYDPFYPSAGAFAGVRPAQPMLDRPVVIQRNEAPPGQGR